jgi:hypothetical protein
MTRAAERELLADASRTNAEIAALVGAARSTISKLRRRLIAAGELVPEPTATERALEALRLDPERPPAEVAAELEVSMKVVYDARRLLKSDD